MKPLQDCRLYTFIDTGYLQGRSVEDLAQMLCDGGSDLIQLRAKTESVEEVERLAAKVLPILEAAGVGLVINDYPEIAAQLGAPCFHVGQEDFFDVGRSHIDQILSQMPASNSRRLLVGLSSHDPRQAQRAIAAGADYLGVGPVFATPTKPLASPVTLEYVRWAARSIRTPWFAIGGINLANLAAVLEAGAQRICVVSAILLAANPVQACQHFRERLLSGAQ